MSRRPARAAAELFAAFLAALALGSGACSANRQAPVALPPPIPEEVEEAVPEPVPEPEALPAPMAIPAGELGTQSLFRVEVAGPDVDGGFRLTLRLVDAERFQLQAVDPVGRALWSLDAEAGEVLWLDHRERRWCRLRGDIELPGLSMGVFPAAALPSLLLGGLPVRPGGSPAVQIAGEARHLEVRDDAGRRWTATYRAGKLLRWALWEAAPGKVPAAQLRRDPPWWILVDRRRDLEVRWRRVVREALAAPLATPEIPGGYAAEGCPSAI